MTPELKEIAEALAETRLVLLIESLSSTEAAIDGKVPLDDEHSYDDSTQFVENNSEKLPWLTEMICDIMSKPTFQRAELYALIEKLCSPK